MTNRELVYAAKRRSFVAFAQAALELMVLGYQHGPYIDLVAAYAEDLTFPTTLQQVVINMPPRHGKSYLLVALAAYFLATHPKKEVMLIVYGKALAVDLAGKLKMLMESAFFRNLYPTFALQPSREMLTDFRTSAGGGFLATSMEGGIQGRGADLILIDDVTTAQNAQYESARTQVRDIYLNTIATRLNNAGAIFMLCHRYHEDDLTPLLVKLGFRHVVIPFRAIDDEHIEHNGVIFDRRKGETLRYFPQDVLAAIDALPAYVYSTQYQQHPVPREAGTIKRSHFPIDESRPGDGQIVVSWDCASSTIPGSSYSVGLVMLRFEQVHYLLQIVRGRYDFRRLKAVALEVNERFRPTHHLVEAASTGFALASELREHGLNVIEVKVGGASKIDRLDAVAGKIYGQQVHVVRDTPGVEDFLDELTAFPFGANDDQVDALSQYLKWVADSPPPARHDLEIRRVDRPHRYESIQKMVPGVRLPGQSIWHHHRRKRSR
ncbi:hypothetical protein ACFX5Q_17020 [Mesorhizobium sp. IMUNJ 23033]|uniref:hypothetical protein n=1 Tax=Mesorhizobium sp. IMUNJ 23033 TaxID=3378039 RepID=UPI00384AD637